MSESDSTIAAELLRRLVKDREHYSAATLAWAKAQGEAVVEPLIDLMENGDLALVESTGKGYVPINAARLLGALGAEAAIPRMLRAVVRWDPDEYEELWDQTMVALRDIGPPVVEPTLALMAETHDAEPREHLLSVLACAGQYDPRILAQLRAELELALAAHVAGDRSLRLENAAIALSAYDDPETAPLALAVVDAVEVDETPSPWGNAILHELAVALARWGAELSPEQESKLARVREARAREADRLRVASAPSLPAGLVQPLDDDEWDEFRSFLAQPGGPEEWGVLGFLHGVLTAPTLIRPRLWMGQVFAEREPDERHITLLSRLYNEVNADLANGEARVPTPSDEVAISQWCKGYLAAVGLDPQWPKLEGVFQLVFPIGVLAGEFSLSVVAEPIDDEAAWLQEMREDLEFSIVEIYDRLSGARMASAQAATTPVRREGPKVGRNDPCPCGSGKKYKKCCLKKLN